MCIRDRAKNPWLGLVFDAVSAELGFTVPPPGMPGPFSLGDTDRLRAVLTTCGLTDVAIEAVPVPAKAPSVGEWWSRTAALAGPLAAVLGGLSDEKQDAIAKRVGEAVQPYVGPSGIELPGVALIASATR